MLTFRILSRLVSSLAHDGSPTFHSFDRGSTEFTRSPKYFRPAKDWDTGGMPEKAALVGPADRWLDLTVGRKMSSQWRKACEPGTARSFCVISCCQPGVSMKHALRSTSGENPGGSKWSFQNDRKTWNLMISHMPTPHSMAPSTPCMFHVRRPRCLISPLEGPSASAWA